MQILVPDNSASPMVVAVHGRMDAVSAPEFEQRLTELIDEGARQVVVDLDGLAYISSAGLRGFLVIGKRLKADGGQLHVAGLKDMVQQVFKLSGFHTIIPVFETVQEAKDAFDQ